MNKINLHGIRKSGRKLFRIIFLFSFTTANGQTDHYWAQQYGAESSLMGGAMIGGVRDNSAIFYNPGAFPFIQYPELSVSANLYKMDKIFIDDGAGEGINLNSAQISIYPQIISGLIDLNFLPRVQVAYGLLTRHYDNILMNTRYTDRDLQYLPEDMVAYIGSFNYANQLNEQWFGLGIGYSVNDWLGIGVTLIGSYRTQTNRLENFFRYIGMDDSTSNFVTYNIEEMIKYKVFTGLVKFGLAWEKGRWRGGLTLTTPSFKVYGRGDIEREFSIYSISDNENDPSAGFIVSDKKTNVRLAYHNPLAIGAGIEYSGEKTRLAFSTELFLPVSEYSMMNPLAEPFLYPPSFFDSAVVQEIIHDFLRIDARQRVVLNAGIGLKQQLWPKFDLLAGFHTDFSAYADPEEGDRYLHSSGSWDLYHFSAGLSYKLKKQIITAGFTYSFSPAVSVDPYTEINPVEELIGKAKVFAQSFAFILGYTYLFPRE